MQRLNLKLDEDVADALSGMGATYAQLRNYRTAEKVLREALSSEPDDATIRFNLGIVCLARKNRDCALSQYNHLKKKNGPLADRLFDMVFKNRVVNAAVYKPKPR